MGGVDKKLTDKEERARLRTVREENRRIKYVSASTSSASYEPSQEDYPSNSSKNMDSEDFPTLIESSEPGTSKSVMRKDFITPKLIVALDRCQLSMRDSVFILEATIDALDYNIDEFPISKSSIQRIRTEKRKERAENIKIDFQNKVLDVVTLHSDGKLLRALSARKSKEECLRVVTSYGLEEQLIAVPRQDNSTGKEQAQAFWKAILDWNLEDKVQILCCDTTASNTGRFNGACALLEKTFYRELLFFACRHHELVLKAVFEVKNKQVTTSPNVPLFKKLKDNWKNIDLTKIQCYRETMELFRTVPELENLFDFYRAELKNVMVIDDCRELIELSIVFLGGDAEKKS
ncbi:hypothetical protein AVEN_206533-1 [Araneus ventricosus]|uniref:DUF4371 domain-containing protein n=1 Tax=Araneus ventricosus TaxID=182803 RepID=A0A4Y2P4U4_ARAVE|nr:hypothetical protein AVEN_206533-1 [Araneus ventricosus]